jgi:hypothetical protein
MGPVQSRAQPQPIVRHSEDAGVTKLRTLAPGWDGQDAPAPTPDAIARLERFLPGIRSVRGASATVTADVEGGASIFLRDRNHNPNEPSPNQATVFFGNDDPGLMVVSVFRPTRVTRCKEWPRADHEAAVRATDSRAMPKSSGGSVRVLGSRLRGKSSPKVSSSREVCHSMRSDCRNSRARTSHHANAVPRIRPIRIPLSTQSQKSRNLLRLRP